VFLRLSIPTSTAQNAFQHIAMTGWFIGPQKAFYRRGKAWSRLLPIVFDPVHIVPFIVTEQALTSVINKPNHT
jgi:hypothetical protein